MARPGAARFQHFAERRPQRPESERAVVRVRQRWKIAFRADERAQARRCDALQRAAQGDQQSAQQGESRFGWKAAATTRAIDHCSTIHHTAVPNPAATATADPQTAAAMPSESGEALARVPTVADTVIPTIASSIGAKAKEESRWNRPIRPKTPPPSPRSPNKAGHRSIPGKNDHDRGYAAGRRTGMEFFPLQFCDLAGGSAYFSERRELFPSPTGNGAPIGEREPAILT